MTDVCHICGREHVTEEERLREEVTRLRDSAPWDAWRNAEARVRELEALIVAWERDVGASDQEMRVEAHRIRSRPRLSTEDEAEAVMGDGQPLVKMREIKP